MGSGFSNASERSPVLVGHPHSGGGQTHTAGPAKPAQQEKRAKRKAGETEQRYGGAGTPPAGWAGASQPRWGVGVPPHPPGGWAGALRPAEAECYTGWLTPPRIPVDSSDPSATMIDVGCNCHYNRRRGISCTTRRKVRLGYLNEDRGNAMLCERCYPHPRRLVANQPLTHALSV